MDHSSDRRYFLLSTLGAAFYVTPFVGVMVNACKTVNSSKETGSLKNESFPVNVRKNAIDPSNKGNLELYKKAVEAMKLTQFPILVGGQQLSWWEAHAEIHNTSCPHGNWYFLPWHRGYLHYFEKVCREFCGDASFALPYWDWTQNSRLPEAFAIGDENSNTLYNKTRYVVERKKLEIKEIGNRNIKKILEISDFSTFAGGPSDRLRMEDDSIKNEATGFSGLLETGPHNKVHSTIQGDMGGFSSPRDPIFWLHHCNVDRLWVAWVEKRTDKEQDFLPFDLPKESEESRLSRDYWLNSKVGGYYAVNKVGDTFTAAPAEFLVSDLIDPAKTGLAYDNVGRSGHMFRKRFKASFQKFFHIKTNSVKTFGLVQTVGPKVITIETSPELQTVLASAAQARGNLEATLRLIVKNIPFPLDPSADVHLYLNSTDPSGEETNPDFIGSVSFFGHKHIGATMSAAFDLVPTIKSMVLAGKSPFGNTEGLTVTIVWNANPNPENLDEIKLALEYLELG